MAKAKTEAPVVAPENEENETEEVTTGFAEAIKAGTLKLVNGKLTGSMLHQWTLRKEGKKLRQTMKVAGSTEAEIRVALDANAVRCQCTITYADAPVEDVLDTFAAPRMSVALNSPLHKAPDAESVRGFIGTDAEEPVTVAWDELDAVAPQWYTPTGRGKGVQSVRSRIGARLGKASENGRLIEEVKVIKANGSPEEIEAVTTFLKELQGL